MPNPVLLEPISEESPCGEDVRWDPAFIQFMQDFDLAKAADEEAVIEGETVDSSSSKTLEDVLEDGLGLLKKTKDIRILALYAEGSWIFGGLGPFSDVMEDLVCVLEKWADLNEGVFPRADEDDGDLGERIAPLGKLLNQIPLLATTVGWGAKQPEISEQREIASTLQGIFNAWSKRVGPAFNDDHPVCLEAWKAIQKLTEDSAGRSAAEGDASGDQQGGAFGAGGAQGDAWDLVDRAGASMSRQDRHSPALPFLKLLSTWRSLNILEIAEQMRSSGVSLEQLLDSVRKQIDGTGLGGAVPPPPPVSSAPPAGGGAPTKTVPVIPTNR